MRGRPPDEEEAATGTWRRSRRPSAAAAAERRRGAHGAGGDAEEVPPGRVPHGGGRRGEAYRRGRLGSALTQSALLPLVFLTAAACDDVVEIINF